MRVISICLQKGGVGKTSLSVSLAAELAKTTGKTLLIDADPQGSATGWIGPELLKTELASVLFGTSSIEATIIKTKWQNLDLIPTAGLSAHLKTFAETSAQSDPKCFIHLLADVAKMGYGYVVIDLSPGWSALERAAIMASDEVVTPVLGDSFALDGLQIFAMNLATLKKKMDLIKPMYDKIIVNALDGRIKLHGQIFNSIKKTAGDNLKVYEIPVDPVFRTAQKNHVIIQDISTAKKETLDAIKKLSQGLR